MTLKEARNSRKISQIRMCVYLGIGLAKYTKLEKQPRLLTLEMIDKILEFLNYTADEIDFRANTAARNEKLGG